MQKMQYSSIYETENVEALWPLIVLKTTIYITKTKTENVETLSLTSYSTIYN